MQKHMHKKRQQRHKRQKKKPVSAVKQHSHTRWKWMIAATVVISGCFVLVAFVINQQSATSDTTRVDSTASPATVTGTSGPAFVGSGDAHRARPAVGVFSLSEGGPIPVPANVLHPTNIARVVASNMLMSIYAGAMARTPAIGAIAILEENITTGEQSLHIYRTAQPVGAVTILAIHDGTLTLSTPTAHGTFDLHTDSFHFA
jgi:hypothetical protein